jgi:hypothetical protein
MFHLLYFITRKPTVAEADFHRYWRKVHGPLRKKIKQIKPEPLQN